GRDDLSTVDYFHLSRTGQARLAAATWPAAGFGKAAPAPAPAPKPTPRPPQAKPGGVQAPRPQDASAQNRIVVISAAVTVEPPALLRVALVDKLASSSLPLLRKSAVGTSVSGKLRSTILTSAHGR